MDTNQTFLNSNCLSLPDKVSLVESLTDINGLFMCETGAIIKTLAINLILLPIIFWSLPIFVIMLGFKKGITVFGKLFSSNENLSGKEKHKVPTIKVHAVPDTKLPGYAIQQNKDITNQKRRNSTPYFTIGASGSIDSATQRKKQQPIQHRRNDKYENRLREIADEQKLLLVDSLKISDPNPAESNEKENQAPRQIVMGIKAKSFSGSHGALAASHVDQPSMSHLSFQTPVPYFKLQDNTLKNGNKCLQPKIINTTLPTDERYENIISSEPNETKAFVPPEPKPRYSLLKSSILGDQSKLVTKRPIPTPRKPIPRNGSSQEKSTLKSTPNILVTQCTNKVGTDETETLYCVEHSDFVEIRDSSREIAAPV